jgi:hypothetical protein
VSANFACTTSSSFSLISHRSARRRLNGNELSGTIPSTFANLKKLNFTNLAQNKLTGPVPPLPFAQYTFVCVLDAGAGSPDLPNHNRFACPLPPNSDQCQYNGGLGMQGTGVHCFEQCVGSSSTLTSAECAAWQEAVRPSAYFTKANPPACQDPAHLTDPCSCTDVISCNNNHIVGVDLHDRGLTVRMSDDSSLRQLMNLQVLNMHNNSIVGPLPQWLLELTSLMELDLALNIFTGTIPPQLSQLTSLTLL